jgi:hypothetical protein
MNAQTAPTSTNYLALWWQPKWNIASADGYTAYVCNQSYSGAGASTSILNVSSDLSALYATGSANQINSKGTSVTD